MTRDEVSGEESTPDGTGVNRRTVLKAIGVTAAIGTLGTGVVGAQEEGGEGDVATEEEDEVGTAQADQGQGGNCVMDPAGAGCTTYQNVSPAGTYGGVTVTNNGLSVTLTYDDTVTVQQLGVKGGDSCQLYDSVSSGGTYFAPINQGGQQADVSNISITTCTADGGECPGDVKFEWNGTDFVPETEANWISVSLTQSKDGEENEPIMASWNSDFCVKVKSLKAGRNTNFNSSGEGTSGTVDVIFNGVTGGRGVKAISNIVFECC